MQMQEKIRQARQAVDQTAAGRRHLDAIFEVLQPYLEAVAKEANTGVDRLDWLLEITPNQV